MINISALPDYLTIHEVAEILRIDDVTVRRWIDNGNLDAIRLPQNGGRRKFRIPRSSFERLISQPIEQSINA